MCRVNVLFTNIGDGSYENSFNLIHMLTTPLETPTNTTSGYQSETIQQTNMITYLSTLLSQGSMTLLNVLSSLLPQDLSSPETPTLQSVQSFLCTPEILIPLLSFIQQRAPIIAPSLQLDEREQTSKLRVRALISIFRLLRDEIMRITLNNHPPPIFQVFYPNRSLHWRGFFDFLVSLICDGSSSHRYSAEKQRNKQQSSSSSSSSSPPPIHILSFALATPDFLYEANKTLKSIEPLLPGHSSPSHKEINKKNNSMLPRQAADLWEESDMEQFTNLLVQKPCAVNFSQFGPITILSETVSEKATSLIFKAERLYDIQIVLVGNPLTTV